MNAFLAVVASNAAVATLLALGLLLLGRAWRHPAALHVAWVVVLLKLFAPPIITAGLPGGFARVLAAPTPPDVRPNPTVRQATSPRGAGPIAPMAAPAPPGAAIGGDPTGGPAARPGAAAEPRRWSVAAVVVATWAVGSCGVALVAGARIARFARALRAAEPAPAAVRAMVADLAARLGLLRVPEVAVTAQPVPPLVWAPGRAPRLVLPAALCARLGPEARAAVLAHELAHVRRGDHLVRLLELAATTVFWWHPVAWLAARQLRELEDECCDARVLALLPGRPRAYAGALVATLEFLAEGAGPRVPLRTAIGSPHSLSRRIAMLARPRPARLSLRSLALILALVAPPLAVAVVEPDQAPPAPSAQQPAVAPPPANGPAAVLKGRVTDKKGAPLPGARVRVAVPATDMRSVNPTTDHLIFETQSGAGGDYRLEVPGIVEATKVSIDALAPGYRRLVGLLMMMGDAKSADLEPGREVAADLALEPALYCRGVVVDDAGKPIAGVAINALASSPQFTGWVEVTATGPDGAFELFNYPAKPFQIAGGAASQGRVTFDHPDYVAAQVDDIYTLDRAGRAGLRVVLPTGHKVAGIVVDDAGKPVADALVKVRPGIVLMTGKGARTDAAGRFALRGLSPGETTLDVRAYPIKQKLKLPLTLDADRTGLEVKLRPIAFPKEVKSYDVLGMKLADVTPELQAAYDLDHPQGAVVLDPGPDFERLAIGAIEEGNEFWMAGQRRIAGLRDFVDRIVAETGGRDTDEYSVRVVYNLLTPELEGTNTQHLKLTRADLVQLKELAERLKAEAK